MCASLVLGSEMAGHLSVFANDLEHSCSPRKL